MNALLCIQAFYSIHFNTAGGGGGGGGGTSSVLSFHKLWIWPPYGTLLTGESHHDLSMSPVFRSL